MPRPFPILLVPIVSVLCSCTQLDEIPGPITITDIHEAESIRKSLKAGDIPRKLYTVTPGSTTTTVRFKFPLDKTKEGAIRQGMKELKANLTQNKGRPSNTLVIIYDNTTLRE